MKRFRPYLLTVVILLSSLIACGLWSLPSATNNTHEGFSSARVAEDLEVISREPHSVAHPEAKATVCRYLTDRLEALGGHPQTYTYPHIEAKKYQFDATNVLAEFPPQKMSEDTTWLMLVAHYDSRYPWKPVKDTVYSKGAADDGYGLGIILECVDQALKYRTDWHQGIKVLFTDAEEVGMQGMKAAYQHNREIFDQVGLIINVESRGPYGPALLFETSPGNERLIDLYANFARYPYTYSLTNVVYKFMPNATDFTIVRDSLPGLNFSAVGDINHYHTDLDNIANIDENTLQHYGEQILPLVKEYLTRPDYADQNYFLAKEDRVFFSVPLLGLFHFSKQGYWLLNVAVLILLWSIFRKEKPLPTGAVARKTGGLILGSLVALLVGEGIAWICASLTGARFKLFGTVTGIPFDNTLMIISVGILAGVAIACYLKRHQLRQWLYATLFALSAFSLIFLIAVGENMMFFLPLCITVLAVFLWKTTSAKGFLLAGIAILLLHAVSFLYILALSLTIGALGLLLFVTSYDLMTLIVLADCYLTDTTSDQTPAP